MGITIRNDPVAAITRAALLTGLGEYERKQQAVALQQQQLAQQDLQQRRGIAANLLSQQIANQQRSFDSARDMQFRAGMAQQGFANQQALSQQQFEQQQQLYDQQNAAYMDRAEWNRRMMYQQAGMQQQFGMFKGAMDAIYDLEGKGAQYSPDQQRYIGELEAARQKAAMDPNLAPEDRINADMQYWSKRSRIVPTQPPPPTKEETIANATQEVMGPDGATPVGTYIINWKDGQPEISFRPYPAQHDDTAKLQAAADKQTQAAQEKQQKATEQRQKAAWDDWESMQKEIFKLDDLASGEEPKITKEQHRERKDALRRTWWERHAYNAPPELQGPALDSLEEEPPADPAKWLEGGQQQAQPAAAAPPAPQQQQAPIEPQQAAQALGVTPVLLDQQEAALAAKNAGKPVEQWSPEDRAKMEAIQRLRGKLQGVQKPAPPQPAPAPQPAPPPRGLFPPGMAPPGMFPR